MQISNYQLQLTMLKKINLLLHTIRHLKPIQVFYQLKYRLFKPKALAHYRAKVGVLEYQVLQFTEQPPVYTTYHGSNKFTFLHLEQDFKDSIDWNFQDYGRLWNYNLQYFNFLLQEDIDLDGKLHLLRDFYKAMDKDVLALEPYPVSLRSINMMRLFSKEGIKDETLLKNLYGELHFLSQRLEYHLLANHLLENVFALMMGGAFFSNPSWINKAQRLLESQLEEQILSDGAHFELSPMYHQIIFFRLLELIDWYANWEQKEYKNADFLYFLKQKATAMRSWLEAISFSNGSIPHFNDSAEGIAYTTTWLLRYAENIGIEQKNLPLGDSGYRSYALGKYECKVDMAQVGPSYQPGHAHADALSFILHYKQKPLFVEVGTSTYEINEIRARERGTAAHNTVCINKTNQSEVWSGFRVAKRAKTEIVKDKKQQLVGKHDGYKNKGNTPIRSFVFEEDRLVITDTIEGASHTIKEFHLHIDPSILKVSLKGDSVAIADIATLYFEYAKKIEIVDYVMANGYNRYKVGKKIVVIFEELLKTSVIFKEK